MSHKFTLGQAVEYRARHAPSGIYVVTAKLPERDGEFEYHTKNSCELHERIARESELHEARRCLGKLRREKGGSKRKSIGARAAY